MSDSWWIFDCNLCEDRHGFLTEVAAYRAADNHLEENRRHHFDFDIISPAGEVMNG